MNSANSVLKPPVLTLEEHNYASQYTGLPTSPLPTVNIGKHSLPQDDISTPSKRFQTQNVSTENAETMDLGNNEHEDHTKNDFIKVPIRKSKSSSSNVKPDNPYKTVIQNRFLPLSTVNDSNDDNSVSPKRESIPPIFLHDSNNYQALITDLNKVLKNNFFTVNKNNKIKIVVSTSDDFRALTSHFDSLKVQYHSFCPPNNRPLCVIMRNVPISLTDVEILTELQANHYPVLKVNRLYNKNKLPMPLCAIELEDSDAGNEIFGLEYLFYSKIQIEAKRKSNTVPQCTRC
jgi:hypothetical protein